MLKPKALLKNNLASTFLYQAHLWQANKVTTLFGCLKADFRSKQFMCLYYATRLLFTHSGQCNEKQHSWRTKEYVYANCRK